MKVRLFCSTHDRDSRRNEVFDYPDDYTDEQLEKEAEEFFWNEKEPCWWFERLENNKKEKK